MVSPRLAVRVVRPRTRRLARVTPGLLGRSYVLDYCADAVTRAQRVSQLMVTRCGNRDPSTYTQRAGGRTRAEVAIPLEAIVAPARGTVGAGKEVSIEV